MKECIILVKDVHPNEKAAAAMVDPLKQALTGHGINVTTVSPGAEHIFDRAVQVEAMARANPQALTVEVHDTPPEDLNRVGQRLVPYIPDLKPPTTIIEFPAVRRPWRETDGFTHPGRKHTSTVSDTALSREQGLCDERAVKQAADLILEVFRR